MRANRDDEETGRFFTSRFRAVRLLDEQALVACAAYVDLNPIRAALAESLPTSDYTSVQRRLEAIEQAKTASAPAEQSVSLSAGNPKLNPSGESAADRHLSPVSLNERRAKPGPALNTAGTRCSDKGFLPMSTVDYLDLLDWTGRQLANGKRGRIPNRVAPILKRLSLDRHAWCELVGQFGKRFFHVAGVPTTIDTTTSRINQHRYYLPSETRKLFQDLNAKPTAKT